MQKIIDPLDNINYESAVLRTNFISENL